MNHITLATFTLIAAGVLPAQDQEPVVEAQEHGQWIADFDQAVAAAKKANKDLFVDFTGSDWCGWCIKLHEEVFDHAAFNEGVDEHFVLVSLDFPRSPEAKAKVPNPARNAELQKEYAIRGFPTILLMTPDGEVFGRTGYQAGGPEKYIESLDKLRTEGKKNIAEVKDLTAKFDAAKGPTRSAVLGLAIDKLASMSGGDVGIDKIAAIVKTGIDSSDAATQEKAIMAMLKTGQADDACFSKAVQLDPKNEKGLYDYVVQGKMTAVSDDVSAKAFVAELDKLIALGPKDAELFENMLTRAAGWSFGPLKDKEGAVKYAKLLKEKAEDPEKHAKLFEQILGEK
jgi:thioredoxin-related protein